MLTFYFTERRPRSRAGWLFQWLYTTVIGSPTHVSIACNGVVYSIGPGDNCFQMPEQTYRSAVIVREELIEEISVKSNSNLAQEMLDLYGVGPMTVTGTLRRVFFRHVDPFDMDCVAASCHILQRCGHAVPFIRTPKGLMKWLMASNL